MSRHCKSCTCNDDVGVMDIQPVIDYGVTFIAEAREGEMIGPLTTESLMYWFKNYWRTARLILRKRYVITDPADPWRRAEDEEVTYWNNKIMAPHVLAKRES